MLNTKKVRLLDIHNPETGRPPYMIAASGLVKLGDWLYVVADDELHLGVFREGNAERGLLVRLLSGELPLDWEERKKAKPDWESLLHMSSELTGGAEAMLAIPSGSKPNRVTGAFIPLNADRSINENGVYAVDFTPLYNHLWSLIPKLNIEGSCVIGELFYMFHRANKSKEANKLIRMPLDILHTLINPVARENSRALLADAILQMVETADFTLGNVGGISLAFTDATVADGKIYFLAAAEDSDDPYLDGPYKGAAIGMMTADGKVTYQEQLDIDVKPEGLHVEIKDGNAHFWVVTDSDQINIPAQLCVLSIPLAHMTENQAETFC
jgi:hypothetical protein